MSHDPLGFIGSPETPHPDVAPDRAWARLTAGNARYVHRAVSDPQVAARRAARAIRQAPLAAVFACSDARSAPERVFDCEPGEIFVVRTAGNVADDAVVASLEFAVWRLGTRLIVVMGHERCGAVGAALERPDLPGEALRKVVVAIHPVIERLPRSRSPEQRYSLAVRANVRRSGADLLARSDLLRSAVRRGDLAVRLAVHDLVTGRVTPIRASRG
jgi:carbonic anhydrase